MPETSTTSQQVERIADTSFDSDTIVLDVEVLDRRIAPAQSDSLCKTSHLRRTLKTAAIDR